MYNVPIVVSDIFEYIHTHVDVITHTYINMYTNMYTCTHTCEHTHTNLPSRRGTTVDGHFTSPFLTVQHLLLIHINLILMTRQLL